MKYDLVISVVTFNQPIKLLTSLYESIESQGLKIKVAFIDNSSNESIKNFCLDRNITYLANDNIGYGAAHNINIKKYAQQSKYFLICNPDIIMHPGCLAGLFNFMEKHDSVILSSCKILNPDGTIQRVHKRLPSFSFMMLRRFLKGILTKQEKSYSLMDYDYQAPLTVPIISGCFMFFRSSKLLALEGFDERFFMYFEDFDLSRRACHLGKVVIEPNQSVTHLWEKGSHKSLRLLKIHLASALKYFLKWFGKNKNWKNYETAPFSA